MVCINNSKAGLPAAEAAVQDYARLMGELQRPASSPVSDFLEPITRPDVPNPRPPQAWDMEKVRHEEHRQKNRLGDERPVTSQLPDHAYAPPVKRESERALDRIDMHQLDKARPIGGACDAMYKDYIVDMSCSITRVPQTASPGIVPCITPSIRLFQTNLARMWSPEDALKLQGISLSRISFTTESPSERMDLAGNAMSTTVIGAVFLAAIIAGRRQLIAAIPTTAAIDSTAQPRPELVSGKQVVSSVQTNDLSTVDMKELLRQAEQASRACYCENSKDISAHSLQKCVDCGETTCIGCGGNPQHNYAPTSRSRILPAAFETYARSVLPVHVQLPPTLKDLPKTRQADEYRHALHKALQSVLSLRRIWRTPQGSTIEYSSASARLHLLLGDGQAEWQFYAEPDKQLASNDMFRVFLKQPLLKANALNRFEGTCWQLRQPAERKMKMVSRGSGRMIPSWWARLGLPDYKDHQVWEYLHIDIEGDLFAKIGGKYQYLPRCGMASESLYKRVDSQGPPVYLFLGPDIITAPVDDFFVFSYSKARREKDEVHHIIARVSAAWRPWSLEKECLEVQETSIHIDSVWGNVPNSCELRPLNVACNITQVIDPLTLPRLVDCSQSVGVVTCTAPASLLEGRIPDDGIIKPTDDAFCKSNAWLFERIRQQCATNQWRPLSSHPTAFKDCTSCAPTPPASGDVISAAAYDRAMYARPHTFAMHVTEISGQATLTLYVNVASLAHRALSGLPKSALNSRYDWRLLGDAEKQSGSKIENFNLGKMPDIDDSKMISRTPMDLSPNLRRWLAWMEAQERGVDLEVEAIQDSAIKPSSLVVEVRARATVNVRGGICAGQSGFDKTTVSLALIQSGLQQDANGLDQAKAAALTGLLPIRATLIICPPSLFKQWLSEIDKSQIAGEVIGIRVTADLDDYTKEDFDNAKIVVVRQTVLSTKSYTRRLASAAVVPRHDETDVFALTQEYLKDTNQVRGIAKSFTHITPGRRLRGKDYVAAKERERLKAETTSDDDEEPETLNTCAEHVGKPLLEDFYFSRIIVDEGHDIGARKCIPAVELKAHKRWVLSSTPCFGDLRQVSKVARLLGVTLPTVPKLSRNMVFPERVDAGREMLSRSRKDQMHRQGQRFLEMFARQSTIDTCHEACKNETPFPIGGYASTPKRRKEHLHMSLRRIPTVEPCSLSES